MEMSIARQRIAMQRGELRGWRPLTIGDVAVVAVQVIGMSREESGTLGMRVVVAGRSADALALRGHEAAEQALRRRSVLGEGDPFHVEHTGELHEGLGEPGDDPLSWPWVALVVHVPERQLPAIAGLTSDTVPAG